LGLDRDGFVVNAQGHELVAFTADSSGNITGATAPLQLQNTNIPPLATDTMNLALNLDASAPVPTAPFSVSDTSSFNDATSTTIFDSLGNSHLDATYYRKAAPNSWESYLFVDGVQADGPDPRTFSQTGALITPAGGQSEQ
jgi:flagellar hook protein FlgE